MMYHIKEDNFDISAQIGGEMVEIFSLTTMKSIARGRFDEFSPDGTTPYANTLALIDDLKTFFFRSLTGGSEGSNVTQQVTINQNSWSGNTQYNYAVSMADAVAGDLIEVFFNQNLLDSMRNTNAQDYSFGRCVVDGTVKVRCKISTFTNIPNTNKFFTVRIIK